MWGVGEQRPARRWHRAAMGDGDWGSEMWHRAAPGPTDCRTDPRGWPMDVVVVWDGGGRGFDWYDGTADTLVPRVPRTGTFAAWSREIEVVGVFEGGRWRNAGELDVLARLRANAPGRWPPAAVDLLERWTEQRLPTWDELVAAVHPGMTWDEISTWLSIGATSDELAHGGTVFDVPDDWFERIDPSWGCLLDGRRLLLHGLRKEQALDYPALARQQLASSVTPAYVDELQGDERLLLELEEHLWNCASAIEQADDLLEVWRRRLVDKDAVTPIPALDEWPSGGFIDAEDPFRYRREAGHPAGFTESQRQEVRAVQSELTVLCHRVVDAIEVVIESQRPPEREELLSIHDAIAQAGAVHDRGVWICSLVAE